MTRSAYPGGKEGKLSLPSSRRDREGKTGHFEIGLSAYV